MIEAISAHPVDIMNHLTQIQVNENTTLQLSHRTTYVGPIWGPRVSHYPKCPSPPDPEEMTLLISTEANYRAEPSHPHLLICLTSVPLRKPHLQPLPHRKLMGVLLSPDYVHFPFRCNSKQPVGKRHYQYIELRLNLLPPSLDCVNLLRATLLHNVTSDFLTSVTLILSQLVWKTEVSMIVAYGKWTYLSLLYNFIMMKQNQKMKQKQINKQKNKSKRNGSKTS